MKLVWLDIESTGLDPLKCDLIEIAACITDIVRPFEVTLPTTRPIDPTTGYRAVIHYVPDLERLDPYVVKMHTENRLWAACAKSTITIAVAAAALLALVGEPGLDAKGRKELHTLGGSSVHFDHGFLRVHMPTLASKFSHRVYDASAIKLFCRSLGMTRMPKTGAHRAMADVNESIAHAKACAEWLRGFMAPPTPEPTPVAPVQPAPQQGHDPIILRQGLERIAKDSPDLWSRMAAKTTLKGAAS